LANQPVEIRGFGPVKESSIEEARREKPGLLQAFRHPLAKVA
jgi:hypothetical protein